MKRIYLILMTMATLLAGCASQGNKTNPLLSDFDTPFGAPPFDKIRNEHFKPAFEQALADARTDIDSIVQNQDAPTFENTVEALEFAGKRLEMISNIFFNLQSAETNKELQALALEISPLLTAYSNDISLNPVLFERIRSVYDHRDSLNLNQEQRRLVEKRYKEFTRGGAALSDSDKAIFRTLTTDLSNLALKFEQNLLGATNAYVLHITDSAQLSGLPEFVRDAAAEEAKERNLDGWAVTLQAPSMLPFMNYSDNRELKKQVWMAANTRCVGGEFDNENIVKEMTNKRLELAKLLGYENYAAYRLEDRMAGDPKTVAEFLDNLLKRSMPYARKDYETINTYAKSQGADFAVEGWDWRYFSEKYKNEKYAFNEEMTKPYFELSRVQGGIFALAGKLFGLTFKENQQIPVYHKDVKAFEVHDESGKFMALLYIDYFPRAGKSGGAWMTSYRGEYVHNGEEVRPLISLVCNFTKPTSKSPSLLTFDEMSTLLHEFGHALHGMLAEGSYESLTGTNVFRDFVELPSQLLENWAYEKEFLDLFAQHYQTGEKIPQALVDKIIAARNFLSGYGSLRQVSFGINDMAWHTLTTPLTQEVLVFDAAAMKCTEVVPSVPGVCFATAFSHIFGGDYAAGYYGYKWAEVLDADAFALFKEKGIFNREVSDSYRKNILSKGSTEEPMDEFVAFRGRKPDPEALFTRLGLN